MINKASDSRFVTIKRNIVNYQSSASYDVGNEIIYDTEIIKSNLCDYSDAYFQVKGNITIIRHAVTQVAL